DLVLPARAGQRRQLAVEGQDFRSRQPTLIAEELRQVADMTSGPQVSDGPAEQPALARGGFQETEQQLHRGRLAGAVGAEESKHLAPRHRHRETGESDGVAESLGQLHRLNGRRAGDLAFRRGRLRFLSQLSHDLRLNAGRYFRLFAMSMASDCLMLPATT